MNKPDSLSSERLFHFKQFSLTDSGCAMKIGTDGVLLGCVAARYKSARTLDVGTGCGLIAFMIAQKSKAVITGIDISPEAVNVANKNLRGNPWKDRIDFIPISFQAYAENSSEKFDLIVCNPPFFANSLKSPGQNRNLARHNTSLKPIELIKGVTKLLAHDGNFLIIAPAGQENEWINLALSSQLNCCLKFNFIPKPGKSAKRVILGFSFGQKPIIEECVTIETNTRNEFTEGYKLLTGEYYLHF